MEISDRGLALIRRHEGFRPTAYKCPAGVWTIGYGHTRDVKEGDTCTMAQGEAWLKDDVRGAVAAVNRLVKVPLTQNQFDALVSFVFNIGISAFATSTLLRHLNDGDYVQASGQFPRWVNGGQPKRRLSGLVARRAEERELFEKP